MLSSINHPVKKQIIECLNQYNNLNLGDIVKKLKQNPQMVTSHILELKQAGFIENIYKTSLLKLNREKYEHLPDLAGRE